MRESFKPIVVILLVAAGLGAVILYSMRPRPAEIIPWRTDFRAAQAEAAQSGKPVFLYLTASWCGPCQGLKHTTWADKDVEADLRAYVPVKIDIDEHPEVTKLYLRTPMNLDGGIPAFRILNSDGSIRRELVGAATPEQFRAWLKGA